MTQDDIGLVFLSMDFSHCVGEGILMIFIQKLTAPLGGIKCMEQYEETKSFWIS